MRTNLLDYSGIIVAQWRNTRSIGLGDHSRAVIVNLGAVQPREIAVGVGAFD